MCAGVMGYGYGNGSNSSSNSNGHVVRLRFHLVFDWIFNYSLLLVAIYLPAALLTRHTCPARVSGISTAHLCTHVRTACPGPLSRKWQRIDCVPSAAAFAFPTHQIPIASLNGIFNAKPQTSKLCWYFHDPFPPYFAFFFFFFVHFAQCTQYPVRLCRSFAFVFEASIFANFRIGFGFMQIEGNLWRTG